MRLHLETGEDITSEKDDNVIFVAHTGCFTDLGKLNLPMVDQFSARDNFCYCPDCLKKLSSLLKWSKSTQNNWLANKGLHW
jgi:hypothetical protein